MADIEDNIKDDEIRVIGGDSELYQDPGGEGSSSRKKKMVILGFIGVVAFLAIVVLVYAYYHGQEDASSREIYTDSFFEPQVQAQKPSQEKPLRLGTYSNSLSSGYTETIDTTINDIPLRIRIPHKATPSLHVGPLNEKDTSIVLVAQAADIRRDNHKIVGAFVLNGQPLAWGKAKTGFCAIINDTLTIGVAENSPLFEKATENGGFFFRQYPLVDNGKLVENEPKNKAIRRSLCDRSGEIMVIESLSKESFHDFAQALKDLEVTYAIYLVGSISYGWSVDANGNRTTFGINSHRTPANISYILWRKN